MPYPDLLHPEPLTLQQATADPYLCRRHSNTVLAQSLWGLWVLVCTRFVWALCASLVGKGFDSKCDFTLRLSCCVFSFAMWGIIFWWDPNSPVDGCSTVSCNFGVLTGEDECTSFYSAILCHKCSCKCTVLNVQLELYMEQQTSGKDYVKAVYCHSAYLTYMQITSCEMPGWMKHKLESRLLGEISTTSDMQVTPPLWQKVKKNWRASWWKWKRRVKKLA